MTNENTRPLRFFFRSKRKAEEFIDSKGDGYFGTIEVLGRNRFKVELLKKDEGKELGTFKDNKITLPKRRSKITEWHEKGHKALGHKPGTISVEEFAGREIDAELYAFEHVGRKRNYKAGLIAYGELVGCYGEKPRKALQIVVNELKKRGIEVSKEAKAELLGIYGEEQKISEFPTLSRALSLPKRRLKRKTKPEGSISLRMVGGR